MLLWGTCRALGGSMGMLLGGMGCALGDVRADANGLVGELNPDAK